MTMQSKAALKPVSKIVGKPVSDEALLLELETLGFSSEVKEKVRRLIVSSSGREKTGKSHFALTGPEPVIYLNIDIGTEGVIEKFQDVGKRVLLYDVRVPKDDAQKADYELLWNALKGRIKKVYSLRHGTVIWDSVASESPLVLKNKEGYVWIGTIEDFWSLPHSGKSTTTPRGEEILDISSEEWKVCNTVWNAESQSRINPWTLVKSIIRHPYKGTVLRFTVAGGTIRVTPNHSLMSGRSNGSEFTVAGTLKVGDELSLPMYVHTPSNLSRNEDNCSVFVGTVDLAWLYGFFVAEGSSWLAHDSRYPGWEGIHMSVTNKDEALADKARTILQDVFHVTVFKNKSSTDDVWHIGVKDSKVSTLFAKLFYNSQKEKVVPMFILNAVAEVKEAFWEGYMAGDGSYNSSGTPEFDTTSPALAAALIWMRRSASLTSRDVSVYTRPDKPSITRVTFPMNANGSRGRIRSIEEETYDGMIYDLETENHAFCAGVGGILCHNTSTEAYELARLSRFGKLTQVMPHNYTEVNNEWRELLRNAYDSSMNTVFIHKVKPVWLNNVRTKDYELSGFAEMDYMSQINLTHYREDTDEGTVYSVYIKDCRQRPGLAGTVLTGLPLPNGEERTEDPLLNFEMLLSLVHDKVSS